LNSFNVWTDLLTYSMEQSPSLEANKFSASQEILHILWNPKFHYCNHNRPPRMDRQVAANKAGRNKSAVN